MKQSAAVYYLSAPPYEDFQKSNVHVKRTFAIGKFDGLHVAHQAILRRAVLKAANTGSVPCMFSFTPHPRYALTHDPAYEKWLTPPKFQAQLAGAFGISEMYAAVFDEAFRSQSAEEFVRDYLLPLGAQHLVVGDNFRFGKCGAYTTADLKQVASRYNLSVDMFSPIDDDGVLVSSSRIRSLLDAGDMVTVTRLLDRHYTLLGTVVKGDQRGRKIGFPTANLSLNEPFVVPRQGVYVADCHVLDRTYRAVMNIGRRPTVYEQGQLAIEVHLLDFEGDLYGDTLRVELLYYIRAERKFETLDHLKQKLVEDSQVARNYRSAPNHTSALL